MALFDLYCRLHVGLTQDVLERSKNTLPSPFVISPFQLCVTNVLVLDM